MISDVIKGGINGVANIPGDKSISHRSIIIPSISNGVCEISNILRSDDSHTLNAFKSMGVYIEENKKINNTWKRSKILLQNQNEISILEIQVLCTTTHRSFVMATI